MARHPKIDGRAESDEARADPDTGFPSVANEAASLFVNGVGHEISDTWGRVSELAGRIFATLYLAGRPMDMEEIARSVGRSKSNVLVNLRALVGLGLAAKAYAPESRRDLYEVGPDYGNIILRAFLKRLGSNLENNGRAVGAAAEILDQLDEADNQHIALMKERVATASRFYQATQLLYERIASSIGFEVDFSGLVQAVTGTNRDKTDDNKGEK